MKRLLLILIAAMSIYACSDDSSDQVITKDNDTLDGILSPDGYHVKYFMQGYYEPTILSAKGYEDESKASSIVIGFIEPNLYFPDLSYWDETESDLYKKYAEYYGDTTWTASRVSMNGEGCIYPLSCISVTTDKDYDELHPANSSINDLLEYEMYSWYDYIQSGYDINQVWVTKKLSDLKCEKIVDSGIWLRLKQKPSTLGTYTFTVSVTFDPDPVTGKTISLEPATTTITFE